MNIEAGYNDSKAFKVVLLGGLLVAMMVSFLYIETAQAQIYADAGISPTPQLTEDQCFEKIESEIDRITDTLDKNALKNQALANSEFIRLMGIKSVEFYNTVEHWTVDPVSCTITLDNNEVKFHLEKGTANHKKIVAQVDEDTNSISKVEIIELEHATHTTNADARNWAGIEQKSGTNESSSHFKKAQIRFTVPVPNDPTGNTNNCGTGNDKCIVSVWTGMSEKPGGADTMFQAGTDSYCKGSNCDKEYKMWLEKVDDSNSIKDLCTGKTVNAGDSIRSWVFNKDNSNKYTVGVYNISRHAICTTSWIDTESADHYALYVVERPSYSGGMYMLPKFNDFNITGEYQLSNSRTLHNMSDYDTRGNTTKYTMKNNVGSTIHTNVSVSNPNSSGSMAVDYRNSNGT